MNKNSVRVDVIQEIILELQREKFFNKEEIDSYNKKKEAIEVFIKSFPLGYELNKAFEKLAMDEEIKRIFTNNLYKTKWKYFYMYRFYKSVLTSVDQELTKRIKYSKLIREDLIKPEVKKKFEKAVIFFNIKQTQSKGTHKLNKYSGNGIIELYSQMLFLYCKLVVKLESKELEIEDRESKLKRTPLGSESLKTYTEIIKRILTSKLFNKVKYSEGKEDTYIAHISDVASDLCKGKGILEDEKIDKEIKKLESRFYNWLKRNKIKVKKIVLAELTRILKPPYI